MFSAVHAAEQAVFSVLAVGKNGELFLHVQGGHIELCDLYELYENGEWTWEKFKEIALAGNQDLAGAGEYDVHGFNQRENLIWSFMTSNGAEAVKKTDAGVELALETPEVMEALEAYTDFMQNVPHLQG